MKCSKILDAYKYDLLVGKKTNFYQSEFIKNFSIKQPNHISSVMQICNSVSEPTFMGAREG